MGKKFPSIKHQTENRLFLRHFQEQFTRLEDITASLLHKAHKKFKSLVSLFPAVRALAEQFFPSRLRRYDDLLPRSKNLESTLEQALKEAVDDATLRKIKRISYSANAATEVINFHC